MIVDIAAGNCEFINNIHAKEKIAFDLREDTAGYASENVKIIRDSFFNMPKHIRQKTDIIFASNIFEHLDSKEAVIAAMQLCADNLNDGGKLLILQPNIKYAKGAYWDFIDHKTPLTDNALVEAADLCGLVIDKKIARFLPYTTKSRLPQHPLFVLLYLMFPPAWLFLGQQSFLVLKKQVGNMG